MPAYDRPIQFIPQPQAQRRQEAVGAVIKFKSTDVNRIQAWLDRAAAAGIIEPSMAKAYDAEYGGPVWYVP